MMPLARFAVLADSYGADLERWPQAVREPAREFLSVSAEARTLLEEARELDAAIAAVSARETALLTPRGGEQAALTRLRKDIAARVATTTPDRGIPLWRRRFRLVSPGAWNFAQMATAGGVAIAAGLLIGALSTPASAPDILVAMLQPTPITMQAE